jgi:hypothetical protein
MSVLTLESLAEAFVAKDAEVQRLKANIIWLEARNKALTEMRIEDKALITKLCDAMEFYVPFSLEPHYREFLQRVREANGWRFFAVQYAPPCPPPARETTR